MSRDKVVAIRPAVLARVWSVQPGPDTTLEDVARAARALDLVPYVSPDGFEIRLTLARHGQTPPTANQVAAVLFGLE